MDVCSLGCVWKLGSEQTLLWQLYCFWLCEPTKNPFAKELHALNLTWNKPLLLKKRSAQSLIKRALSPFSRAFKWQHNSFQINEENTFTGSYIWKDCTLWLMASSFQSFSRGLWHPLLQIPYTGAETEKHLLDAAQEQSSQQNLNHNRLWKYTGILINKFNENFSNTRSVLMVRIQLKMACKDSISFFFFFVRY